VEEDEETIADKDSGDLEVVEEKPAPEDQGDLNVWIKGEAEVKEDSVVIEGQTNLLEESKLHLKVKAKESALFGATDTFEVDNSGAFKLETDLPGSVSGAIHINVTFDPTSQKEHIEEHYADQLEGNFVRLEENTDDEIYEVIKYRNTVVLDSEPKTYTIEKPTLNKPDDSGNEEVWIEADISKEADYLVLHVKSNLVERTRISAKAVIPNYMTTGYSGATYT